MIFLVAPLLFCQKEIYNKTAHSDSKNFCSVRCNNLFSVVPFQNQRLHLFVIKLQKYKQTLFVLPGSFWLVKGVINSESQCPLKKCRGKQCSIQFQGLRRYLELLVFLACSAPAVLRRLQNINYGKNVLLPLRKTETVVFSCNCNISQSK